MKTLGISVFDRCSLLINIAFVKTTLKSSGAHYAYSIKTGDDILYGKAGPTVENRTGQSAQSKIKNDAELEYVGKIATNRA